MNRFVRKVSLLPELLLSMVESSSGKLSNSQLEKRSTKIAAQEREIQKLQSEIQNHLDAGRNQATLVTSQKVKIEVLEKEVQLKTKQLQDQISEFENLKLRHKQESIKLVDNNRVLLEKSQTFREQSCKIKSLSSEKRRIESLLETRVKTFQSLRKQVATQVAAIENIRKDSLDMLKFMRMKVFTEISNLRAHHGYESAKYVSQIERLKLEVENKGNQIRSQAVDIHDLRKTIKEKTENLLILDTQLKEKKRQLQENEKTNIVTDNKVKAQAVLNRTLVSKIDNLWSDLHNKNKMIASQNKEIESLKSTISDITKKQRAQLAEMSGIVNNLEKYKQEHRNGICNKSGCDIPQLQDQTNMISSNTDALVISNLEENEILKDDPVPGVGVCLKENVPPKSITTLEKPEENPVKRGIKRPTSESQSKISSGRGFKCAKLSHE